ncbi:hypothetical protein B6G06_05115 [Actinomyces gaoshouyii]|nr:hypothetical protein B6G06_05115 [Actinomyces gaoshouyii]
MPPASPPSRRSPPSADRCPGRVQFHERSSHPWRAPCPLPKPRRAGPPARRCPLRAHRAERAPGPGRPHGSEDRGGSRRRDGTGPGAPRRRGGP